MASESEITDDINSKLQAVKYKRTTSERDETNTRAVPNKKIKFRNYNPHTEELKDNKINRTLPKSIESEVQDQLKSANNAHVEEVNLSNLAPKKIDWDLKRDISRKLDKLERHTQKAIIDIIRQSTRPPLYTLHFFITPGERIQSDSESLTLANAVMNTDN
jgi:coiled-coil domain-containing protein 12